MFLTSDPVLDQVIPVIEKDITGLAILFLVWNGGHDVGFTNGGECGESIRGEIDSGGSFDAQSINTPSTKLGCLEP
jgi:hypothetical protein